MWKLLLLLLEMLSSSLFACLHNVVRSCRRRFVRGLSHGIIRSHVNYTSLLSVVLNTGVTSTRRNHSGRATLNKTSILNNALLTYTERNLQKRAHTRVSSRSVLTTSPPLKLHYFCYYSFTDNLVYLYIVRWTS